MQKCNGRAGRAPRQAGLAVCFSCVLAGPLDTAPLSDSSRVMSLMSTSPPLLAIPDYKGLLLCKLPAWPATHRGTGCPSWGPLHLQAASRPRALPLTLTACPSLLLGGFKPCHLRWWLAEGASYTMADNEKVDTGRSMQLTRGEYCVANATQLRRGAHHSPTRWACTACS